MPVLASIPSPSDGIVHIGPVPLHAYGMMLAIGVLVAARLAEPRARARGFSPGVISQVGTATVIGGVVGARVYHLFTGYDWDAHGIAGTIQIWKGGLSIWGAVGGGLMGLWFAARRLKLDFVVLADAIGPCVAVAQGIGRWGNWFNQELFGRPSTLPWAVQIDRAHRPAGFERYSTFQPTFLYESLWCFLIFFVIVWAEKRWSFRRGQSFALYVALYTFARIFMEWMRIDEASKIFGLRFNAVLSAVLCIVATICFIRLARMPRAQSPEVHQEPRPAAS
jgi:prolipoprotein diacylglyceryl transferase